MYLQLKLSHLITRIPQFPFLSRAKAQTPRLQAQDSHALILSCIWLLSSKGYCVGGLPFKLLSEGTSTSMLIRNNGRCVNITSLGILSCYGVCVTWSVAREALITTQHTQDACQPQSEMSVTVQLCYSLITTHQAGVPNSKYRL